MASAPSTHKRRVKTPTLLQMEAVECGAAALGIVLHYYGLYLPLEELRTACGVSRDGSKASNVVRAAQRYGLVAKGMRLQPEQLFAQRLPLIVFWEFNHFVVVEGRKGNRVYLNDPATGPRQVSFDEFDKSFTGVALVMEPGDDFKKKGAPPSLIGGLKERLAGNGVALGYIVLVTLALVVPGLVIPGFSKVFIDDFLIRRMQTWIEPLLAAMVVAAVANVALTWLQQHHLLRLETKLSTVLSVRFLWHVLRLPIEFFNQRYTGDIVARIRSNDTIAWLISGDLGTGAVNFLMIGFFLLVMALYDWTLTAIAAALAVMNVVAMQMVSRRRQDRSISLEQDKGKLLATGVNGIQTIETLKATGAEDDFFTRWTGLQARVLNGQQTLSLYDQIIAVLPVLLASVGLALVLGVGGYRIVQGDMTLGTLVAFQLLYTQFNVPIRQLVQAGGDIQRIRGDLARLDDVFRYELDRRWQTPREAPNPAEKLTGRLELRNLSFGYSPLDPPLIEEFNLSLRPGSRVALVGATGSGKSTVARLILGLYRPWSGEILYDGVPIDDVPPRVLVDSVSSVDQSIFLFGGTVMDNLTLWDATVDDEAVTRAAKDAAIQDVILSRKGGLSGPVDEGGRNFSGGQGQRLEIARALVKDPAVLVLDEATSALDPGTEKEIDSNLRRRGCTCVIVAHRLSTIRDCDEIIVLDKGTIVERGTHDQLMAAAGAYADLIASE